MAFSEQDVAYSSSMDDRLRERLLLGKAAEEACELGQRLIKAQWFGLDQREQNHPQTNRERIVEEWRDLCAMLNMIDPKIMLMTREHEEQKADRVQQALDYAHALDVAERLRPRSETDRDLS